MRRKFFEATEQSPRLVAWILHHIAHLYHIEERLREAKAGPALREAVRAAESGMIHRRLRKAIDKLALRRSILPKSKLGKAIRYAINQWTNLEVYLGDGRIEICNNLVENAIRPTKLGANYANMRIMRRCFSNPQLRARFEIASVHNYRLSRNRKRLLVGLNRRFFWLGGCIRDNAFSFI